MPPRSASAMAGAPGSICTADSAERITVLERTSPKRTARGGVGVRRGAEFVNETLGWDAMELRGITRLLGETLEGSAVGQGLPLFGQVVAVVSSGR